MFCFDCVCYLKCCRSKIAKVQLNNFLLFLIQRVRCSPAERKYFVVYMKYHKTNNRRITISKPKYGLIQTQIIDYKNVTNIGRESLKVAFSL